MDSYRSLHALFSYLIISHENPPKITSQYHNNCSFKVDPPAMEVAYNEATPSSHPFLDGICHSYSLIIHHPAIGDPP
jgi:hypothetical protein